MKVARRMPVGAELQADGTHFRVWAPRRKQVEVVLGANRDTFVPLESENDGYFSGLVKQAKAGDLYWLRLDGDGQFPDPASRFQPDGPHGPSQIVDPDAFQWTDQGWQGCRLLGQVIYEMHIGTFTREGTYAAAIAKLPQLAELGITVLEVMPLADFPGKFGWGYDGVNLFAPTRLYGSPDDFRRFVDEAHRLKMGVILDVVYNHIGPDGNYLGEFAEHYVSKSYLNEWGDALNFDDEHAGPVREYFASNAAYWIDEYHLDGLRLDATQQIYDKSPEHILAVIGKQARAAAKGRDIFIVAENERQEARLVRPLEKGGYGLDGMWNDDLHHSARVALTGRNEAYYTDYLGNPQELISAIKWGYLYQGQHYRWQNARRGHASLDLEPAQFVTFIQNHDQVSNGAFAHRPNLLSNPARYRAITALILLAPGTPMLFQGQEFGSNSSFEYFADHNPELAVLVAKGRAEFLTQFRSAKQPDVREKFSSPHARETFERCILDWSQWDKNKQAVELHKDLLKLRREDSAFRAQKRRGVDGAVLGEHAFVLRYFQDNEQEDGQDRLVVVNLGRDLHLNPAPEPLLAPPEGTLWQTLWSSESVEYGGSGTPPLDTEENWRLPGEATVVLKPVAVQKTES